jgi:hypothetical protein
MDDLAQKIDPIQRNNIEFENLDDALFENDFKLNELQGSEADDMYLHDADLMMWEEAMDVLADAGNSTDTFAMTTSDLFLCVPAQSPNGNGFNYNKSEYAAKDANNFLDMTSVDDSSTEMMLSTSTNSSQSTKKPSSSRPKQVRTPPVHDAMASTNNSHRKKQPNNANAAQAHLLTGNAMTLKEEKALARGNYRCGRCGLPKVNHVCQYVDAVGTNVSTQVCAPIIQMDKGIPFPGERFLTVSSSSSSVVNRALPLTPLQIAESPRSMGGMSRSSMDVDDASSVLSFGPPPALQQRSISLDANNAISNKHLSISSYNIDVFYEEGEDTDDVSANTANSASISAASGEGVLVSDELRHIHNHMVDNPMLLMHHRHPNQNNNSNNNDNNIPYYINDQPLNMAEGVSSSEFSNNNKVGEEDEERVIGTYINNRTYMQQQYVNRQQQQQPQQLQISANPENPESVQASEACANDNSINDTTINKPRKSSFSSFLCTVNNDQADSTCGFPFFCF